MTSIAYVMRKYNIERGRALRGLKFKSELFRLRDTVPGCENIVIGPKYVEHYDLDRRTLEHILDGKIPDVPEDLRDFARELLKTADPDLNFVHVEIY